MFQVAIVSTFFGRVYDAPLQLIRATPMQDFNLLHGQTGGGIEIVTGWWL
jgi:hypothetical protein